MLILMVENNKTNNLLTLIILCNVRRLINVYRRFIICLAMVISGSMVLNAGLIELNCEHYLNREHSLACTVCAG